MSLTGFAAVAMPSPSSSASNRTAAHSPPDSIDIARSVASIVIIAPPSQSHPITCQRSLQKRPSAASRKRLRPAPPLIAAICAANGRAQAELSTGGGVRLSAVPCSVSVAPSHSCPYKITSPSLRARAAPSRRHSRFRGRSHEFPFRTHAAPARDLLPRQAPVADPKSCLRLERAAGPL